MDPKVSAKTPEEAAKLVTFSDDKSHEFYLDKGRLSDPYRLGILIIAACLAYLWITYLGLVALRNDWIYVIHRSDRHDWNLFLLGLALLDLS